MALNRLVDAELDARNPRTAAREIPAGTLSRGAGVGALRRRARALPRRGLPARPDRALALADPGRDVRRLPVPQARHVALPPLARRLHRPRAARRLARGDGLGAVGGVGALRRAGPLGRRASTSSTRSSTSSTTAPRACARGRRASASAACSRARASSTSPPCCCSPPSGVGLGERRLLLARRRRGRRPARLRALARPPGRPPPARRGVLHRQRRHQRRLLRLRRPRDDVCDADGYRAAVRRRGGTGAMIAGEGLEKRYGRKRALDGRLVQRPRGGLPARHGPNGSGKTTLLRLLAGLAAPTEGDAHGRRRARRPRLRRRTSRSLYRELTRAREPRALRPPLPRARAPRAERDAARALRPLGRARASASRRSRAG